MTFYRPLSLLGITVTLLFLTVVLSLRVSCDSSTASETNDALALGDEYFRKSNYSGALNEYSKLGNDVRALIKKAEIYRLQRKFEFVQVECQRIIDNTEDDSKNLQAHLLLAEVDLLMGDFSRAAENAEAALRLDTDSSQAKQLLPDARNAQAFYSQISHLKDKEDATRQEYVTCSHILGDLLNKYAKESTELRLFRAKCALFARQLPVVHSELKKIFAKDRGYLPAHLLYSRYLYMLGAADKAREHVRNNCLSSDPENRQCKAFFRFVKKAEELSSKAQQQIESRNWPSAKKSIQEYIEYAPQSYNIDEMKARYCTALAKTCTSDNYEEAVKYCSDIINEAKEGQQEEVSNEFVEMARLGRVEAYLTGGDLETAERELGTLQNSTPQNLREELNELLQRLQREKRLASQKDHYKTLGLDKAQKHSYNAKDIKNAYRKAAMKYHPDKFKNASEEEKKVADKKFREATDAYEVLTDPDKRARYDSGEWDGNNEQQQQQQQYGHPGGFHFQGGGFPGGFDQFFTQQGAGGGGFKFRFG